MRSAYCTEGVIQSSSIPCETSEKILKCHNSYDDSQSLGNLHHYSCPDLCVPPENLCQGISWCDKDWEICGPQLRCYEYLVRRFSFNSPLVINHHFCLQVRTTSKLLLNNQQFDKIDRSDEEKALADSSSLDIDISEFKICDANSPYYSESCNDGILCGSTCRGNDQWCEKDNVFVDPCETENGIVSNLDERICGNPLLWRKVVCTGIRCRGRNMFCSQPWYTRIEDLQSQSTCDDKSDQVFYSGLTCRQHSQMYKNYHELKFCSEDKLSPLKPLPPYCGEFKEQWLSEQIRLSEQDPPELDIWDILDPHNCRASCNDTKLGLDCMACTNETYHMCPKSGECVHPDLVCDGHPQCKDGEDENLELCYQKYIANKIVKPYASFRCPSVFYKNIITFSTPCNGQKECFDNSDEDGCNNSTTSNRILYSSAITIALIFVTIRIYQKIREDSKQDGTETINERPRLMKDLLDKFEKDINDQDAVQEVNLHLHHAKHSLTVEKNKEDLIKVYDVLAKKHNNNEGELYLYMHQNFDPVLVQKMVDAKFPGITDCLISCVETAVCRPIVTDLSDLISRSEFLKRLIQNTATLVKIEVKFIDIMKDLCLTILMLRLIGGPQAIIDLPNNFGSVIVGVMFLSIILPMLLGSLHLAMNNFNMFYDVSSKGNSRMKKYLMAMLLFLLSPIIPIVLESRFLDTAEEARKLAQNYDLETVQKKNQCRKIRKQILRFVKIELGKFFAC